MSSNTFYPQAGPAWLGPGHGSHYLTTAILIPPFVRSGPKTKPHVPCTGKWGLRVSRLLDTEAVFGSESDTPTRARNLEAMILKPTENVKEFK
jgi:hypothetical protein